MEQLIHSTPYLIIHRAPRKSLFFSKYIKRNHTHFWTFYWHRFRFKWSNLSCLPINPPSQRHGEKIFVEICVILWNPWTDLRHFTVLEMCLELTWIPPLDSNNGRPTGATYRRTALEWVRHFCLRFRNSWDSAQYQKKKKGRGGRRIKKNN